MRPQIIKQALLNSIAALIYVSLIGLGLKNAQNIFGSTDPALTPVAMLMLLVLSAAIMAMLVFGKPVMWYLDGQKKEAVGLVGYTIGFLAIFTVIIFVIMVLMR